MRGPVVCGGRGGGNAECLIQSLSIAAQQSSGEDHDPGGSLGNWIFFFFAKDRP